ncbi:DUF4974 domain-containing protein [Aestuariibaculum sp. YM273]|uniref:FecR family protein n=1 Tax=Aestuariibaculum sp. YM273 TaxID=3070659 RepID=UPI0027DAD1F6|nr:FecR family protein [Aestuariibaculum sp. YM273]WMI64125.1 DUF4974 domain-containing protein [Aestuariibaculum sp. YM273]
MDNQDIDRLILRLINNTISEIDSERLVKWLEIPENLNYFNEFVKVNQLVNSNKKFDHRYSLKQFLEKSQRESRFKKRIWYVAASLIIFISVGIFISKNNFGSTLVSPQIVNTIEVGGDKAVLTTSDGTSVLLEKGKNYKTEDATSNGEELVYKESTSGEIAYNTLSIPRGGQYILKLADGTKVWLNSDTKLKYPVSFANSEVRQVEILYGEAYFDVSPSTNHNGSKFKVVSKGQEVVVLGTEFNIKAYKDEPYVYTTLVEGKVNVIVNESSMKMNLKPKEQAVLNLSSNEVFITEVETYYETAWTKGLFAFKGKPLSEIMKVLSRWYDTDIYFDNEEIKEAQFNGILGKNQNLEEILSLIKKTKSIENYEIQKNGILIK